MGIGNHVHIRESFLCAVIRQREQMGDGNIQGKGEYNLRQSNCDAWRPDGRRLDIQTYEMRDGENGWADEMPDEYDLT
ncbi:MAG: hypothetical protein PVS3B3_31850 [Ktedonobacteraceae bacterium]